MRKALSLEEAAEKDTPEKDLDEVIADEISKKANNLIFHNLRLLQPQNLKPLSYLVQYNQMVVKNLLMCTQWNKLLKRVSF